MYFLPQEIEVWYIIPALRREIAKCLIKKRGLSYEKTGEMLGVTKAAVSQYIKGKRAAKIILPKEIENLVCASCQKMIDGESNAINETLALLKVIREKELGCEVCGKLKEGALEDCKEIKFRDGNYRSFGEFPKSKTKNRRKK